MNFRAVNVIRHEKGSVLTVPDFFNPQKFKNVKNVRHPVGEMFKV